jgi:tetratricopeptide (TPR) repeat protein
VLTEPKPDTSARFMTGVWHYARGLAFVHTGKARKSRRELKALRKVLSGRSFREYPASLNGAVSLLQIGEQILAGEIAAAKNDYNEAIAYLSTAVRLQDGIVYMEPPDWYFPSRHYLGAILLEAGRPAEAETVYWQDLRKNPVNGYALIGLQQAQLAQGQTDRAAETANRLKSAWSQADVKLTNSRY